jgi:polysaccharide biosynthesis protein VpsM
VDWKRKILGAGRHFQRTVVICLVAVASARAAAPDYARAAIAEDLAVQVREIANTSMISRDRKERRITVTVRIAVVAATAYRDDRGEVIGIASELAVAASRAAPSYAEVIAKAVAFVPAVSRYAGAASEIRSAALAAARGRQLRSAGTLVRRQPAPSAPVIIGDEGSPEAPAQPAAPSDTAAANEAPAAASPPAAADATAEPMTSTASAPVPEAAPAATDASASPAENTEAGMQATSEPASISTRQPLIPLGDNASLTLSTDLGVRRDTNIFLAEDNKVAATILSATPGIDFNYGQNSLTHALLDYEESFNRYSGGAAPNVNLASATGDFGFDDGSLKLGAGGQYQQLYQNNIGILNISGSELIRSNITDFNGSIESALFSKMGVGVAATYTHTAFETPGLFGNTQLNVPMNLYFAVTPKVDLSAGYAFSEMTPEGTGSVAKGGYYNIGARGNFTSKLTGGFTVGYLTERVPGMPPTHDLGLTANLNYEITPKTRATIQATRDFATSAQGQVLKNGSYSLGLSSDITNRWQLAAGLTYRTLDYGQELYAFESALLNEHRIDNYWEGRLQLSYIFTQWFNASISYVTRDDHSTLPGVEFSDNVFSLDLKFQY